MPIPNVYNTSGEPKFLSLTLQNAATGRGYITFYGAGYYSGTTGSNVASYALIASTFPAGKLNTGAAGGSQTNFDMVIQKPMIVEGDCFVTYTTSSGAGVSGSSTTNIQKISDNVTTTLVSASGAITSGGTARRNVITLPIKRTLFKPKDKFRLRIEIGNAAGEQTTLWHDPKTRINTTQNEAETGATENTDMIIDIPIVILD